MTEKQKQRFWSMVDKTGNCWLWKGYKFSTGYGGFMLNGKMRRVHRIAYGLTHFGFDTKLDILHSYDNPACVNPFHLWQGTAKDNLIDMARKQRGGKQKLSVQDVKDIRSLPKGFNQSEVAKKYNLDRSTIGHIINRDIWKHI